MNLKVRFIQPILTSKDNFLKEIEVTKNAIETIFESKNVKVKSVKIINVRKKPHKMGRYEGFKPAVRKAIVTLEEGTLDVFEI